MSTASATTPTATIARTSLWALGAALVLLAFNLRVIFPSVAVLVTEIEDGLGLSHAVFGYLTTLPVLCMGVFAPFAPWGARRFGMERTLFAMLVLLTIGTVLRGTWGVWGMFLGTTAAGAAIAVANVLMPALVKRDFPARTALMTSVYVTSMYVGASFAAGLTVPVSQHLPGGWHMGLAIWALPAAAVAVAWRVLTRKAAAPAPAATPTAAATASGPKTRTLWTNALAWRVTLFMGLQSAFAYCAAGWIAPILRARGMGADTAGGVTSIVMIATLIGALCTPLFIRRLRDQRALGVALMVVTGCAFLALLFLPLASAIVWAALEGFASGSVFAVALTVIALRAADTATATRLSSMAQTAGYLIAATGPLLVGLLLQWTGGFAASAVVFIVIGVVGAWAAWGAGADRTV